MSNRTIPLTDQLYEYMLSISLREAELLRELRIETARDEMAQMQIAPEQGQFMALLIRLLGAKKCIEIGVFTGYSSLWVALALPPGGRLIACDISEKWTRVAQRYWQAAGVTGKIDLRLAPAEDTLAELLDSGEAGTFDFAFIDADKTKYDLDYEGCLSLIRTGGLIAIDNIFWGGAVVDSSFDDADTAALRIFNRKLHDDPRVEISLVPIADGLTLARKL